MKSIRRIVSLVAFGLLIAAIVKELRLPPDERTWHGTVAQFFPYDFRLPTPRRLQATFWNPSNPGILVPRAFGVGWDVNFAALVDQVRRRSRFV